MAWQAKDGVFPDQYHLDNIIKVDGSISGCDQGYSGWEELEDGRVFVVNYTDDTAPWNRDASYPPLGISWIRGMYVLSEDLPQPEVRFSLVTASSMTKIHRKPVDNNDAFLSNSGGKPLRLDGARGEYVHGQIVIVPQNQALKRLTWSAEPLCGPGGTTIPLSIRAVGYLRTEEGHWWPDPLLSHLASVDVPVGSCQPLWVTVAIPRGSGRGTMKAKCE